MFRTALIGSAIVAGCVIGGCKDSSTPSSNNQSAPPSVTTPAADGSKTAAQGSQDVTNVSDTAKSAALFTKISQELKDLKIDDAASDLKTLQGMRDKLSAEQQGDLDKLATQVAAAQQGAHAAPTTMPSMPPMH